MEPLYDWDEWEKAARADADDHHKAHTQHHMKGDPRCPDCVRARDRRVAEVLNAAGPVPERAAS